MAKKLIWIEVTSLDIDATDIDSLMRTLTNLKNTYGNCKLYEETYNYSETKYLSVQQGRLETDEEESKRELADQQQAKLTQAKEKSEYARLQAKFGDTK